VGLGKPFVSFKNQREFQDPKMEVRPYFGGIFTYIGLT
jgi:hypothetical protein